jgi:hypothetical protein
MSELEVPTEKTKSGLSGKKGRAPTDSGARPQLAAFSVLRSTSPTRAFVGTSAALRRWARTPKGSRP